MSLQVLYFLIIIGYFLCLFSGFGHPGHPAGPTWLIHSVFSVLGFMVTSVPFFHPSHSLTRIGWLLCAPVAGAVLVQWVHRYLHVPSWLLGLAVTSGGWSLGGAFLPFSAGWFLAMDVDLLHFRSFLLWFFYGSRGSSFHSPCPLLAWDFSGGQCPFPLLSLRMGAVVLGFRGSSSLFPSCSFRLVSSFVPGETLGLFLIFIYIFFI